MDDSVTGNNDKSPKLDSHMSNALDDSANLDQPIRKINDNGSKMDKLSYQICHTSSPFSFEKNISEMNKYLEKLDQSSIYSTTSDTEMCAKEVNVSDKTPNVPSQNALLEIERLRQEFKQQIDALGQELMSKIEAKMSDGMNELRAVFGTINWSGDESSSKIGSFIEESENRQLAECRNIIENTPVLRGGLAGKTKRGLRKNTEKDLSDNVINFSEDLSTLEASVEHCNAFGKKREKPEASNESPENAAHDLDLILKREEMEVRQIDSLQMTRWVEELREEERRGENDKLSHRNRAKDESKPAFDQRTKAALPVLFVALFIILTLFGLVAFFFASLDAQIDQRRKIESELKLVQENLEENSKNFSQDKASTEREIEELRNNLYVEIKERRKTESKLKLAQGKLEELRRDKDKAENDLKRSGEVDWLYRTLIGLALFGSNWFALLWVDAPRADLLFWSFLCLFLVCVAWLSLAWLYAALIVLSYSAFTAKKDRKEAKVPFARSDVVIVKSGMSLEMQNHAIELMLESMKECTCAADVTKFITGKMREKYGSEWICFISNGKPNPINLGNRYFLSVYLKMDVVYIELMACECVNVKISR